MYLVCLTNLKEGSRRHKPGWFGDIFADKLLIEAEEILLSHEWGNTLYYKTVSPARSHFPNFTLASSSLRQLVLEVDRYNNTINNVKVLDQLKEAGNLVTFSDRERILDALILTREDLIRAIKTERILRENPGFRPESFANNIIALKSLEIGDKASNYGKYFNELMQVAIDVQSEMKTMFDK